MKYEKLDQTPDVALPDVDRREWDGKGQSGNESSSSSISYMGQNKFLLVGVAVIVLVVVIVAFSSLREEMPPSPDLTSLPKPPTGSELLASTDIHTLKSDLEKLRQENIDFDKFVNNLTGQLEQIMKSIASLSSTIQLIKQDYSSLEERLTRLSDKVSDNSEKINLSTKSDTGVEDKLLIEQAVSLNSLLSDKPAFRLISVEQWDSKPAATIALDGHTNVVHEGEFVAAWKILSIDTLARSIKVAPKHNIQNISELEVDQ